MNDTTQYATLPRRPLTWGIGLLALLVVMPACGDDDGGKAPPARPKRPVARLATPGGKVSTGGLQMYRKVEAVLQAECFQTDTSDRPDAEVKLDCKKKARLLAAKVRRKFVPRDFEPDVTGVDNRDPYRSYVVRQQSINSRDTGDMAAAVTEMCTAKNMVAPNPLASDPRARRSHSIRDLRLVGIVLRGTRSYALFNDRSSFGHIVRRGDCLGKEKARVTEVGAGFVRLEVAPEVGVAGTAGRPSQKREIQLHPEELQLDEDIVPEDHTPLAHPTTTPKSTSRPPTPSRTKK